MRRLEEIAHLEPEDLGGLVGHEDLVDGVGGREPALPDQRAGEVVARPAVAGEDGGPRLELVEATRVTRAPGAPLRPARRPPPSGGRRRPRTAARSRCRSPGSPARPRLRSPRPTRSNAVLVRRAAAIPVSTTPPASPITRARTISPRPPTRRAGPQEDEERSPSLGPQDGGRAAAGARPGGTGGDDDGDQQHDGRIRRRRPQGAAGRRPPRCWSPSGASSAARRPPPPVRRTPAPTTTMATAWTTTDRRTWRRRNPSDRRTAKSTRRRRDDRASTWASPTSGQHREEPAEGEVDAVVPVQVRRPPPGLGRL